MLLRWMATRSSYLYQPDVGNELLVMPESGPGYQLVTLGPILPSPAPSAQPGEYVAFNAELLVPIEIDWGDVWDPSVVWTGQPSYDDFKAALNPIVISSLGGGASIIPGTGTAGAPRSTMIVTGATVAGQRLWRVSAYRPDKRISPANELSAGAYTTSDLDKDFINTGLGAVGRLALPTPFPAKYAYAVVPAAGAAFVAGTVRPAFGQAGGGVEVTLHAQTAPGSVSSPVPLPDI